MTTRLTEASTIRLERSVVVLGMHRSGTSAITRVINLLGVPLPAGDLFPPDENNPKGYWESSALVEVNDSVLARRGGSWAVPPPLEGDWATSEEFVDLRAAAASRLATLRGSEQWLWKDPRSCLTFPLWLSVLPGETTVVIVIRHPLEVARSLGRRDGFSRGYALALWERYVRQSLLACRGLPAFVTRYERLLDAPEDVVSDLRYFLQARGFDVHDPDPEGLAEFLDPALRRARVDAGSSEALGEEQGRLLELLNSLSGPHEAVALPELAPEPPWIEALFAERRAAADAQRRSDEQAGRLADVERGSADLRRGLNAVEAELRVARDRIAEESRRRHELEAALERAQAELDVIRSTRSWRLLRLVRRVRAVFPRRHGSER